MTGGRARTLPILLLGLYAVGGAIYIYQTSFVVEGERYFSLWDDGMISMRFARNLAAGDGLGWNVEGERVQGFSNLGVTLVMAALHLLPVSTAKISGLFQLLNLAVLLSILWMVHQLSLLLFDGDARFALGVTLATALYGPLAIWSLQGSDFGIIAAVTLLAFWRVVVCVKRTGAWPLSSFAILALGVLMRFDFVIIYCVFLALSLWVGNERRTTVLGGLLLVVVVAGFCAWSYLYYGDPLPNTFYLKATGCPKILMLKRGLRRLYASTAGLSMSFTLLMTASVALFHRRKPLIIGAFALISVLFAYNVWIGGDWLDSYASRFVVPAMPLFMLLVVGGSRAIFDRVLSPAALASRRATAGLVIMAVLASTSFNPVITILEWWSVGTISAMFRRDNRANVEVARYLIENTDPSVSIAHHWAGVPPYFAGRHAIDVFGRCERHIAKLVVDRFDPGHSKWDWDYVLEQTRPDIIAHSSRGLMQDERFHERYVAAESTTRVRFFVHKASVSLLHDETVQLTTIRTGDEWRPPSDTAGTKPMQASGP